MQFHGNVAICLLLFAGNVGAAKVRHDLKHEMSSASSFLINQQDAGGSLDDDKMAHLTDSIQGLFDAQASLDSRTGSDQEVLQIVRRDARNKAGKSPIAKPPAAIVVKAAKPTQVKAAAKPPAAKIIAAVVKPAQGKAVAKPPTAKVVKSAVAAPTPVKAVAKPPAAKVVKAAVAKLTQMKAAAKPTQVKAAAKRHAAKVIAAVAKPAQGKAVAKPPTAKVVKSAVAAPTPVKAVAKVAHDVQPKVAHAAAKDTPSVAKLSQKKGLDKVAAAATAKLARAVAKLAHKKVVTAKQQQQPKVAQTAAAPAAAAVKPKARKPVAHIATKVSRLKVAEPVMKNSQTKVAAKVALNAPHSKLANMDSKATQPKTASKLVNTTHKVAKVANKLPQTMVPKVQTNAKAKPSKTPLKLAKQAQRKVVNAVAKLSQQATHAKVQPTVKRVQKAVGNTRHPRVAKVKAPLVKAAPLKGAKHGKQPVAKVVAKTMRAAKVFAKRPQPSVVAKAHARVGAKLPVSVDKKRASNDIQPTLSKPIAKVQVAASRHIKVVVNTSNTLLHGLRTAVNATVAYNHTGENKTKVTEEAVVSLPMASFALDIHPGNATKPKKPKFPGNATQKKAWDKKEAALENEIVALRTRLNKVKVNVTSAKPAKPATPAAAGTFNSHLAGNADTHLKASTKLVVANGPAPMDPIRQQNKPAAKWPTMTSVAGPISLRNVHSDGVPPQKDAIEEQNGKLKKVMGSTFTGTPAKKVQSVMALDAVVEHTAFDPDASSHSWLDQCEKWVSSFFARVFKSTGSRYPSASAISSAPHQVPHQAASLLDTTLRTPVQDMERTARSTKDEAQHIIALGSVWGEMEEADKTQEEEVRREDEAERQRAVTLEVPPKASKAELRGRHGPDMSAFWGTLEKQDGDIVKSVSAESGGEYDRLTKEQDDLVKKAAKQLTNNDLHTDREVTLKHNDPAFLSKTLHDTWESLETKDKALEKRIHDSPDLQMLQLDHQWRSLK